MTTWCAACGHVDVAHADRRGCARLGCDCRAVLTDGGLVDPQPAPRTVARGPRPDPVCDCGAVAVAHVSVADGCAIVRPARVGRPVGDLVCIDCAHVTVDVMLLRALDGGRR